MSAQELALTNPDSIAVVSVSGELEKVFDLRTAKYLDAFVDMTRGFKLSTALKASARSLKLAAPSVAGRSKDLLATLLTKDWHGLPVHADVPANSQIFGTLIYQAGIEGILYPSKLTERYRQIWCTEHDQAALLRSALFVTSTPSLNGTPVMTLARCWKPRMRHQRLSAHMPSL